MLIVSPGWSQAIRLGSKAPERVCFWVHSGCWRNSGPHSCKNDTMSSGSQLGITKLLEPSFWSLLWYSSVLKSGLHQPLLVLWISLISPSPTNRKLSLFPHLLAGDPWGQEGHHIISFSTLYNSRSNISCNRFHSYLRRKELSMVGSILFRKSKLLKHVLWEWQKWQSWRSEITMKSQIFGTKQERKGSRRKQIKPLRDDRW